MQTYENLSPRKKALADMIGMLFVCILSTSAVSIVFLFDLWFELAMLLLCYGIFGMIKLLYQSRVAYYEYKNQLKR